MLRRHIVLLSCAALFSGCETVPERAAEAPAGPRARLDETAKVHSQSKADFFVVTEINGKTVKNSMGETFTRNYGRGMVMTPYFLNQDLPAGQPVKVGVMARTYFAAPALDMVNDVYQVKGVVEFTPQENGRYIVRGELGEKYSAVWIEDRSNDAVVGQKVEIKGNAKLGFWDK
jgi:hypothetical protein